MEIGIKKGLVKIPVVQTKYWPGTKGMLEATEKYKGRARVRKDNQLVGWVAGYPFPKPKNAVELAWNYYPMSSRVSAHDDNWFFSAFYLFSKANFDRSFELELQDRKYMGRTDIPPLGDMELAKKKGIAFKESIVITRPFDVRGFIQLRERSWNIYEEDRCYAYIPALRRIRRLTGTDVTDPLLGSDTIPDDFEVWRQKLNPKMTFKVLKLKDFLTPRTYLAPKKPPYFGFKYDYKKNGPFMPIEWELRPMCVLEIKLNDPGYVYSKRVVYGDAMGIWLLYWGEQYDLKGRLWRANGQWGPSEDGKGFKNLFGWMYMNHMQRHYTVMYGYPYYGLPMFKPLDESSSFTIQGLLKRVR